MMRACAALAALAITVSGCTTVPQPSATEAVLPAEPALGVWQYPASDFPAMCITFLPGGRLQFQGGFLFFNPGRWERQPNDGLVHMTLGGTSPFPFGNASPPPAQGPSAPLKAVSDQRLLVYRIGANTTSLEFAGFIFYRTPVCTAV